MYSTYSWPSKLIKTKTAQKVQSHKLHKERGGSILGDTQDVVFTASALMEKGERGS